MCRKLLQAEINVETHRSDIVYDVDASFDELALVRACNETHENFEREPRVTDALDVEECNVCVRVRLVDGPVCCVGRCLH